MKLKKNIILGKYKIIELIFILIFIFFYTNKTLSEDVRLEGNFVEIKILDKVSSKNNVLKIEIGKEYKFKNLLIKSLKCKNSEFDDDPEITAYLQVKDLTNKSNDEVFIFNGDASGQVAVAVTAYSTSDNKSINGTVSTASTFNADVKQSVLSNIGQVNITPPPTAGASAGISTVTSGTFTGSVERVSSDSRVLYGRDGNRKIIIHIN